MNKIQQIIPQIISLIHSSIVEYCKEKLQHSILVIWMMYDFIFHTLNIYALMSAIIIEFDLIDVLK